MILFWEENVLGGSQKLSGGKFLGSVLSWEEKANGLKYLGGKFGKKMWREENFWEDSVTQSYVQFNFFSKSYNACKQTADFIIGN